MGEHKQNIGALLRDTLPRFPPLNREGAVEIGMRVVQKRHVFLKVPGDETDQDDLAKHAEWCTNKLGTPQVVHQLGEPLPPELCDIVLVLSAMWADTSAAQPTLGRMILPGEVLRVGMDEFLKNAEASIGGGSRIIRPTLQVVGS